jgi:hypothetical protein
MVLGALSLGPELGPLCFAAVYSSPLRRATYPASGPFPTSSCPYSRTSWRNCPKRSQVCLQRNLTSRQQGTFRPVSLPYTDQLHGRSVTRTLFGQFRKANSRTFISKILHSPSLTRAENSLLPPPGPFHLLLTSPSVEPGVATTYPIYPPHPAFFLLPLENGRFTATVIAIEPACSTYNARKSWQPST